EWTGHYAGGVREIPVLEIKAIYHRNDPIVVGVPPMGAGPDEMARYRAVMRSATIKQNMSNAGVPGVQAVWCHEVGGARMLHAVSITQRYPGHPVQAAHVAAQCGASARQVSAQHCAQHCGRAQGAGKVRLAARWKPTQQPQLGQADCLSRCIAFEKGASLNSTSARVGWVPPHARRMHRTRACVPSASGGEAF